MAKTKAKKQVNVVLETGPQCRAAIREIQVKTGWSINRMAAKMEMTYETLRKVSNGLTKFPGDSVREDLASLLQYVRSIS